MKDYSSFELNDKPLTLSSDAIKALREVARQARHLKKSACAMILGKDGSFDRVVDAQEALALKSDIEAIRNRAYAFDANCVMLAHGHLKGSILDGTDVYFDYRYASSGDICDLIQCQTQIDSDVKIYMACVGCDDLGNVTMQVLSYDGETCYQYTNLEANGSRLQLSSDNLVKLEHPDAKY